MHFCKNPFDVLDYYGFVDENGHMNEFSEVEALADTVTYDEKKFCTTKLKVGAKLSFAGFVKTCVDFVLEKTTLEMGDADENKIGSSGDYAQISSTGEDSVICCAGHDSAVKAKKGSWITLSEWEYSEEKNRVVPLCVKTEYVNGKRIKADTFYRLVKGEFKEVN